jgi:hypothetical protein
MLKPREVARGLRLYRKLAVDRRGSVRDLLTLGDLMHGADPSQRQQIAGEEGSPARARAKGTIEMLSDALAAMVAPLLVKEPEWITAVTPPSDPAKSESSRRSPRHKGGRSSDGTRPWSRRLSP